MRLMITQSKRLIQEIKATEDFRFDKVFIESLKKPGKTTMIRFSDSIPGSDDVMLTPNISKYQHGHTPAAIYGYPLHNAEVLNQLRNQSLQFNNLPIIIVYWVDDNNIVDLNTITKEEGKDLFDQIISIKGRDTVVQALQKWKEREEERARWRSWGSAYDSIPSQLLKNDLNFDKLSLMMKKTPGEIFWNLIREIGTGIQKTALLLKLRLKQKDADGNIVEKRFNTILDKDATIDIRHPTSGVSQAPVQALTLTSSGLGSYKFYNNPSASIRRRYHKHAQKSANKDIIGQKNFEMFEKHKTTYLSQMNGIRNLINSNVKFDRTSEGYKVTLKLPAPSGGSKIQKSIVKRITAAKQKLARNPPITEEEISKRIATDVVAAWIAGLDGPLSEPGKMKMDSDVRQQTKMIVASDGDYFEFNIQIKNDNYDILSPMRVYAFLHFLFDVYHRDTDYNPFRDWKNYEEIAKIRLQYL